MYTLTVVDCSDPKPLPPDGCTSACSGQAVTPIPGGLLDQNSSLWGNLASSWQYWDDLRGGIEACLCLEVMDGFQWCPEVIPLFTKGISALTCWLSRRLWQKSSGSVVPANMDASFLSTDTSHIPMLLVMDVSKQAWINTFSVYTYFKRIGVNLWSVNSDMWYLFLKLSFAPVIKLVCPEETVGTQ